MKWLCKLAEHVQPAVMQLRRSRNHIYQLQLPPAAKKKKMADEAWV